MIVEKHIVIEGNHQLNGDIKIKGAKNAVLKQMVLPLLASGKYEINNVPTSFGNGWDKGRSWTFPHAFHNSSIAVTVTIISVPVPGGEPGAPYKCMVVHNVVSKTLAKIGFWSPGIFDGSSAENTSGKISAIAVGRWK